MSPHTLVAGAALPTHRASAKMPAEVGENKIHEDGVARERGFRGALVPGVTVYAWMTHPVAAALGPAWLDRGTFATRFAKPVYFDEPITIETRVTACGADGIVLQVRALNPPGEVCATATMGLPAGLAASAPDPAAYPAGPLPAERPRVSRQVLAARPVLGTPVLTVDAATARAFRDRVSESLPLFDGPAARVHPGLYLDLANRALRENVLVSPWIHVESEGRHFGTARVGERLETRGKVKRLFERKGHEFVELDLLLVAEGARPIAQIRHVAIYQLR